MNILVPMAGRGVRFADAGYDLPKPLIKIFDKPMIHYVIDNILDAGFVGSFTFVVLEDHKKYGVENIIRNKIRDCNIVFIPSVTDGQLRSCFYAEEHVNSEEPLLIVNSDNYFKWSYKDFNNSLGDYFDASILTFKDPEKKSHWSFARVDNGVVVEVKEKERISDFCLGGAFLFRQGSDFIKYGKLIFDREVTTNKEYYISSVFNVMIEFNRTIITYNADLASSMGTPKELESFKHWFKDNY